MKKLMVFLLLLSMYTAQVLAGQIVVTTSTYELGANTAVYYTGTGDFIPAALGQDDQDVIVDTDGEYVYFLSRTLGSVTKYHPFMLDAETATAQMVWQYSVGPDSNPYDMVFLDTKAYVIRYNSSEILVVDQNAADEASFVLGTIDISMYDEYGVPEAAYGFEYGGIVYVVLQRMNGFIADKPGYLIAINPANDSVLDLVPETNGIQGIELLVKDPQSFSQVGSIAYIAGHQWNGQKTEGVQSIDFADPAFAQTMLLDEETLLMDITGVSVFDSEYGVCFSSSWVPEGDTWVKVGAAYWFDPATGELGAALPVPVPDGGAVMVDGIVYVGSQDDEAPGIYPVDPITNTLTGTRLATTMPPISMVYVNGNTQSSVGDVAALPGELVLDAPYPNPFNPATTVSFTLASPGMTEVAVYNVAGQQVATLIDGELSAGGHAVVWHAGEFPAGIYVVSVRHDQSVSTAKMLLVK